MHFIKAPKQAPYPTIGDTFQCCDCGAVKVYKPDGVGTGYAITDGRQMVCYECCAVRDSRQMQDTGSIALYLDEQRRTVSNWPGTLQFPAKYIRYSRHNMAGRNGRRDVWFNAFGREWHGVNIGDNQIARCKALKG